MPSPLPQRATEYLTKLVLYSTRVSRGDDDFSPDQKFDEVSLRSGEEVLGVYRNNAAVNTRSILITNVGLHIEFINHIRFASYDEMTDINWLTWDRMELTNLENRRIVIDLKSNERLELNIIGSSKSGLDLTHFHNFLLGAVQARQLEKKRTINKMMQ